MLSPDPRVRGDDHAGAVLSSGVALVPPAPVFARADLLAVIAHELRQPLSAAISANQFVAELVDEGSCGDLVRRNLQLVDRCMREALRLADDILALGRAEAGALRLRRTLVDVGALLEETRARAAPSAAAKGVDLRVVATPALPFPVADPDRLLQVVANLCGNAVKFTPAGGRVALVATATSHMVRVAVTDSGPGVSVDELPRLFDPHWQANRGGAGAGLGLAIAKWLVEAHGGRITAHRGRGGGRGGGGGLTVAFTIPLLPADAPYRG